RRPDSQLSFEHEEVWHTPSQPLPRVPDVMTVLADTRAADRPESGEHDILVFLTFDDERRPRLPIQLGNVPIARLMPVAILKPGAELFVNLSAALSPVDHLPGALLNLRLIVWRVQWQHGVLPTQDSRIQLIEAVPGEHQGSLGRHC